ncbi:DNA replication helicase protein MCM, intein-containing [Thermococcus sp. 2319x1]|uniref:LAGLIDADG family homing endonuclease n=1 Tax=Thermococcus sp. 2319x1 TaxID=1674923 RepID=UPI00073AB90E|nr:LAGLIDADG family homing endonuclease [Thermococcus sp. 2319x1]ALV63317.1 DNA replication helicase protein MCM, intein-containing [Thermococcus sp. 2319x1]
MDKGEMIERFVKFLREYTDDSGNKVYLDEIRDVLTVVPRRYIAINWEHLNAFDPELAGELIDNPEEVILAAEDALQIILQEDFFRKEPFLIHARFHGLPKSYLVKELGSEHINKFIQVEGIITRMTEVKPFVSRAVYICKDCGHEMVRLQKPYANLIRPNKCEACGSRNVELDVDKSTFLNFQSFRLQDRPESLKGGQMPRFVDVILLDDLVDIALPGDRVVITGILRVVLEQKDKRPIFRKIIEANYVEQLSKEIEELEITPEDEQKIKELAKRKDIVDVIVDSIAPAIYGMKKEKLGIALALFGGNTKQLPDGTRLRGESHVLLVGDPGVAKSQILRYVANLAPRAIYTSGKSSSAAGLCVAPDSLIITENGTWELGKLTEDWIKDVGAIKYSEGIYYAPYLGESFSFSEGKIKKSPMSKVWKLKSPRELIMLKTNTGKEVITTPETQLLVFKDGSFKWKKSEDIQQGDYVVTLRKIEVEEKPLYVIEMLQDLDELVLYGIKEDVKRLIEKIRKEKAITKRELAKIFGVNENNHNWVNERARGNITMKHLKKLVELAEVPLSSIHPREVALQDGKRIRIPKLLDEKFAYFAGLIAGDGYVSQAGGVSVRFSNRSSEMRRKFKELAEYLFGIEVKENAQGDGVSAVHFHSKVVAHLLKKLGVPLSPKSEKVDIPPELFAAPKEVLAAYLRGVFDCNGTVVLRNKGSSYIEFDTPSEKLAKKIQLALLRFGVVSHLRKRNRKGYVSEINGRRVVSKHDRWELRIYGENIIHFAREIGFEHPEKKARLEELVRKLRASKRDTNIDVIPGIGGLLRKIRTFYGMGIEETYGTKFGSAIEHGRPISRRLLKRVLENLEKADIERVPVELPNELRVRIGEVMEPKEIGLKREEFYELFKRKRSRKINYALLVKVARALAERDEKVYRELVWILSDVTAEEIEIREKIEFLRKLANSELLFERVRESKRIKSLYEYVYDITVEGSHSFIANGFVVHNTAAAVRDELTGSWVLEAGVLVLADMGIALIDEIDKMSDRDRSSIHEALEQQTVSISKAGITATLNARTTVIAAANPKYGRFNRMKSLPEQVDLPPTLLSRFDLIFVLLDEPDEKLDSEIAEHILKVRKGEAEAVAPKIPHELLKKYIAYARKNIKPVLSKEAMEEIKRYYVKMRRTIGRGGNEEGIKPIPITARQLEALIRLSEAHAKMRLSEIVTKEDARAAIELMEYTLRKTAMDEEGNIDVSILEVGKSSKKINKMDRILSIIKELQELEDYGAPKEEIIKEASKYGIGKSEVEKILEELKANSMIYEPRSGYYKVL